MTDRDRWVRILGTFVSVFVLNNTLFLLQGFCIIKNNVTT